ncbi:MAG: tRNA (cytidine(34)-2'-O)-methyltransferase [Lachnospiraceae bacterium]|nr:tRNA (cytidine(34)-2'-O)-methyltransferase [Lachnospiraceae bacterium]
MIGVVLLEPEMPANTGNIGRTCVAAGSFLHLIEPLGFHLDEKSIKRAGLDYWDKLNYRRYINLEEFLEVNGHPKLYMVTTKARKTYTEVSYEEDAFLMFGKESAGIPERLLVENAENCVRIPMLPETRSLNLSNAVSIVLYEALRQNGFPGMQHYGELHRLSWDQAVNH